MERLQIWKSLYQETWSSVFPSMGLPCEPLHHVVETTQINIFLSQLWEQESLQHVCVTLRCHINRLLTFILEKVGRAMFSGVRTVFLYGYCLLPTLPLVPHCVTHLRIVFPDGTFPLSCWSPNASLNARCTNTIDLRLINSSTQNTRYCTGQRSIVH